MKDERMEELAKMLEENEEMRMKIFEIINIRQDVRALQRKIDKLESRKIQLNVKLLDEHNLKFPEAMFLASALEGSDLWGLWKKSKEVKK